MAPAQTELNLEFEGLPAVAAPERKAAGNPIWVYLNRLFARLRHYG